MNNYKLDTIINPYYYIAGPNLLYTIVITYN